MGKAQKQKETPQERALAEVATARMADYRKRWLPLQKNLAEDIVSAGKPDSYERQLAGGKAATDNTIRFGEAQGALESGLARAGAAPGSGKFKLGTTGIADDRATSRGLSMVASDQAIDDAYLQGLTMLTKMGQGQAGGAMEGMGQVARRSAAQAEQDASLAFQRRLGNAQVAGQVAGLGLSGGFKGLPDTMQAKFSQTDVGGSGFGTGLAYGNRDYGEFI